MTTRIFKALRLLFIFLAIACFRSASAQLVDFAAVGYGATNSLYSTNGIDWVAGAALPFADGWGSTVYGEGTFVTISGSGDTNMLYSTNGINWTLSHLPFSDSWDKVAYGDGLFFATTWGSKSEAYSTNGINWSGSTNLMPVSGDWYCLAYGNGVYVAIAPNSSNAAYSLNGTNWTLTSMPYNAYWQGVTFGNGKFVAVVGGTSQSAYSTNGSNWLAGSGLPSYNWASVTYGNGVFVANAYNSGSLAYSTNGINWTSASMPYLDYWYSSDFATGAGVFATLSQYDGHAAYSTNGINWYSSPGGLPVSDVWYGIAARNDPPTITNQPVTQSGTNGDSITFSVGSGGSPPFTYQWSFDGANIAEATNSSLLIFNATPDQAGSYSVIVSNDWGSAASSSATLTLSTPSYRVLNTNHILGGSTTLSNFTFQGDTTYYINGPILLYGTTTAEGGTVIKFGTSSYCQLDIMGSNFVCATAPYRPAVFTSMDDDSVGLKIDGSTGNPWDDNAEALALYFPTGTASLHNLRFSHLAACVSFQSSGSDTGGNLTMSDFQAVDCVQLVMSRQATCYLFNGLVYDVSNIFGAYGIGGTAGQSLAAVNVTAHECENYALDLHSSMNFTNCLFLDVTNIYSGSSVVSTSSTYFLTNDPSIFQIVGAAGHYLAEGTYQGLGTTNIGQAQLADIQGATTDPPVTNFNGWFTNDYTFFPQARRDNSGSTVDIGYHYNVIDYALSIAVTNATVTVLLGTVLAGMGPQFGIWLEAMANFNSTGTATSPNYIVRYNTVQEQANTNWETTSWLSTFHVQTAVDINVNATFRFTDWTVLGGDKHYDMTIGTGLPPVNFQDCQFYNGAIAQYPQAIFSTNCLFQRVNLSLKDPTRGSSTTTNIFVNNLFLDGEMTFNHDTNRDTGIWTFRDNLFDQMAISLSNSSPTDIFSNNAFVTTNFGILLPSNNIVILTNSPAYQIGTLGEFYYPTNQANLIFQGSELASATGLYHYTVTTNNVIDGTNQVSIGFHYVACSNGVPISTPGDGIPDYIADANGNGIVDTNEISWTNYYSTNGLTTSSGLMVFTPLH